MPARSPFGRVYSSRSSIEHPAKLSDDTRYLAHMNSCRRQLDVVFRACLTFLCFSAVLLTAQQLSSTSTPKCQTSRSDALASCAINSSRVLTSWLRESELPVHHRRLDLLLMAQGSDMDRILVAGIPGVHPSLPLCACHGVDRSSRPSATNAWSLINHFPGLVLCYADRGIRHAPLDPRARHI